MSDWSREHLGRIVWWRPCWRLRIEEYRRQRRSFHHHRDNWRRWGDPRANTLGTWWRWWWTGMKIVLKMREKSMAVVERDMRLDKERAHFAATGQSLYLCAGPWECHELLGYAGMHYTTLQSMRGEPVWAEDLGVTQ